jgi:hypothetical protein
MTSPPPPPPGPGVRVPFAAPPAERDRRRMWITLGVGGALLALCCVGGIFGIGALVVQTSRNLTSEATQVVGGYLGALRQGNYQAAYNRLCERLQGQVSVDRFESSEAAKPRVTDYSLDQPRPQGSVVLVQTEVTRAGGEHETPEFQLVREGESATSLKICGIRQ